MQVIDILAKIPNIDIIAIITLIVLWGFISIFGLISWWAYQFLTWKYLNFDSQDWWIELGNKFLNLPVGFHINSNVWDLQQTYDKWEKVVWWVWEMFYIRLLPTLLWFTGICLLSLNIDIKMTIVALLPLPFVGYLLFRYGASASDRQREIRQLWDRQISRFSDALTNIKIVKIFVRWKYEEQILKENIANALGKQIPNNIRWALVESSFEVFQFFVKILVLSAGIFWILKWQISIGSLVLFLTIVWRIYAPVLNLIFTYREYITLLADYRKARNVYIIENELDSWKITLAKVAKNITFKNLSFSYPSSPREVLSDISFEIRKWQKIAFVGHTGSGKSTITQLLMRFYEPSSGTIEIDGTNIYDFTLESYRSKFAAVFQDTTLFNETIRHNLEYVRDGITQKELIKACKEANIIDFIESLPEKWETQVGERGLKLSGGEKQRIAIARAILANPEILILDEATSALDTKTERLVQEAFEHLMHGRTSIIIAHRLSTIQSVDTIYFMEKWHIIASGNHRELYEKSKEYRELVDLQHDGFVGEIVEEEIV
jgi:ABC-type multidrug transport system fused ATPase/permease subunit